MPNRYNLTEVWKLFVLTCILSCAENNASEPSFNQTSCGSVDDSHRQARRCYHSLTVPFGSECTFDEQIRTCIDGGWQPNWPFCENLTCEVENPVGVERYHRVSVERISENGGRLDWSPDGEWLVFDRLPENEEFFDVFQMRPDGSEQSCLTCDHPDLPNGHQGQPAYHPSGNYIIFQVEMAYHPGSSIVSHPGAGLFCDLWLLELTGGQTYQLTFENNSLPASGVLHPHFSPEGDRLFWGRRQGAGGEFGDWEIVVADFEITGPSLLNEVSYNPGERIFWYEAQDWSGDGEAIYFAASLQENQHDFAMDLYRMSLGEPEQLIRLTRSAGIDQEDAQWEEHAKISPRGDVIAYMSSEPYGLDLDEPDRSRWLKTDLWLMNLDGSEATRYTFFNEPGYDEYDPTTTRVAVADMSWNPDGSQIAFLAIKSFGVAEEQWEEIWVLNFGPFVED